MYTENSRFATRAPKAGSTQRQVFPFELRDRFLQGRHLVRLLEERQDLGQLQELRHSRPTTRRGPQLVLAVLGQQEKVAHLRALFQALFGVQELVEHHAHRDFRRVNILAVEFVQVFHELDHIVLQAPDVVLAQGLPGRDLDLGRVLSGGMCNEVSQSHPFHGLSSGTVRPSS